MRSPASALNWEIWRKNRWGFAVILGLLAACAALNQAVLYFEHRLPDDLIAGNVLMLLFSNLVLLIIFSHTEADGRGWFGLPARMFILPVRTSSIVNRLVLYGITSVVLIDFAWLSLLIVPERTRLPILYLLILSATGTALFQAIVWGLAKYPKTQTAALLGLLVGFVILVALPFDSDGAVFRNRWESLLTALMLAMLPLAYAAALAGVCWQRSGGWPAWSGWRALVLALGHAFPRSQLWFSSPCQAQFWIEWRRNGRTPLLVLVILTLPLLIPATDGVMDESNAPLIVSVLPVANFFILPLWAAFSGLVLARDAASRQLPLSSFFAARPVSTHELVAAKLKVAAVLAAAALALLLCGSFLWATAQLRSFDPWESVIHPNSDVLELALQAAAFSALIWNQLVGLLPLWLTGRVPGFPWSFLWLLGAGLGLGHLGSWFYQHPEYWTALTGLLACAFAAKIALAAWSFRQAIGRDLLSPTTVGIYSGIWLLGTAVLIMTAPQLSRATPLPATLTVTLAATLFPLARIGLAALALDWNRHR